jgi:hypothetical protein
MGNNGFNFVKEKFTRDIIADKFWKFLTEMNDCVNNK